MLDSDKPYRDLERFNCIRNSYDGHFCGKTLVDIGCRDGYFGREFITRGGQRFVGIDTDPIYPEFNIDFRSIIHLDFDIGFYLNLHYHDDTHLQGYVEWLATNCKTVYTSCRRNFKDDEVKDYKSLLEHLFSSVENIWDEQQEVIYKCE